MLGCWLAMNARVWACYQSNASVPAEPTYLQQLSGLVCLSQGKRRAAGA